MDRRTKVEIQQHQRDPWLATTCWYCSTIYTHRSSEPRPFTCGDPQCEMRYTRDERLAAKQGK